MLGQDTWNRVQFVFTPHKGAEGVFTVKLAEEDFEALEDNQVLVQVSLRIIPAPSLMPVRWHVLCMLDVCAGLPKCSFLPFSMPVM